MRVCVYENISSVQVKGGIHHHISPEFYFHWNSCDVGIVCPYDSLALSNSFFHLHSRMWQIFASPSGIHPQPRLLFRRAVNTIWTFWRQCQLIHSIQLPKSIRRHLFCVAKTCGRAHVFIPYSRMANFPSNKRFSPTNDGPMLTDSEYNAYDARF